MAIEFTKYHGLGNDFILIDNRSSLTPVLTPEKAVQWCDRHFGIGADGVIFALPGQNGTDYTMRIFNSDGSEPEMCGNGIRCLAVFLTELEGIARTKDKYSIHTLAGVIVPQLTDDGQVKVDMGEPRLLPGEIPTSLASSQLQVINHPLEVAGKIWDVTCVSMGNPHCIIFVEDVAVVCKDWAIVTNPPTESRRLEKAHIKNHLMSHFSTFDSAFSHMQLMQSVRKLSILMHFMQQITQV